MRSRVGGIRVEDGKGGVKGRRESGRRDEMREERMKGFDL